MTHTCKAPKVDLAAATARLKEVNQQSKYEWLTKDFWDGVNNGEVSVALKERARGALQETKNIHQFYPEQETMDYDKKFEAIDKFVEAMEQKLGFCRHRKMTQADRERIKDAWSKVNDW